MSIDKNKTTSDQALIDQIKKGYAPEPMSARESNEFDAALMDRVDGPSGSRRGRLVLAMAMAVLLAIVGMNIDDLSRQVVSPEQVALGVEPDANLEWVATLVGVETPTEEFEDLPEEYATMMMIIVDDDDEWSDY